MPKIKDSTGLSLLEVMMSLGVIALLIPLAMKLVLQTNKTSLRATQQLELRTLARTLMNQVDCANIPKSCVAGSLLNLPRKNGTVLISSTGTTVMGGWTLRALCTSSNQVSVQAAKISADGTFMKDPVNGQLLDWSHPRANLFPDINLCSGEEASPASEIPSMLTILTGDSCTVSQISQLPCNAPDPPQCSPGYVSVGVSMDIWGGDSDAALDDVFGQRWIRYCVKN